jgi:hypothetical protein
MGIRYLEGEGPEGTGYAGDEPAQGCEEDDEGGENAVGEEESGEAEEHGSEGT